MAIGWFTLLKSVPWATVIGNAPVVADGAKKLWKAVGNKPVSAEPPLTSPQPGPAPDDQSNAALLARLAAVEAAATKLHEQMLASSELINALADQSAQLIARVEGHRVRVLWLTRLTVVLAMVTLSALVLLLVR